MAFGVNPLQVRLNFELNKIRLSRELGQSLTLNKLMDRLL